MRNGPAGSRRETIYELMPLFAHSLARFRLQAILNMQEFVVKMLNGRRGLQRVATWGVQCTKR